MTSIVAKLDTFNSSRDCYEGEGPSAIASSCLPKLNIILGSFFIYCDIDHTFVDRILKYKLFLHQTS